MFYLLSKMTTWQPQNAGQMLPRNSERQHEVYTAHAENKHFENWVSTHSKEGLICSLAPADQARIKQTLKISF